MKNRNIQFKPTAGVLIPLLLACLAAVSISAPNSASAGDQVPFIGTLAGCVETQEPVDQCTIHAHAALFGNATQLGAFTGTGEFYENFCEDPPNITYAGSFHLFAANGDEIYGTFEGYLSPTGTPGVYDNHETSDVTGGTGRFTSATGHWDSGGQVDFTTEPPCFSAPRARVDLKCRLEQAVENFVSTKAMKTARTDFSWREVIESQNKKRKSKS